MNRIKLIICILCIFLLVGCKKSTSLTCTKTTVDNELIKINQQLVLIFESKKFVKIIEIDYFKYKEDIESNNSYLLNSLNEDYEKYKESKGIDTYAKIENDLVRLELTFIPSKMTDKEKGIYDWLINYDNYTNSRKSLEKEGYTCK